VAPYLVLTVCAVLARALALGRFARSGLLRRYRWFCAYLIVVIVQNAAWFFGTPRDRIYATWWLCAVPLTIAFAIAATIELWKLLVRSYLGVELIYRYLIPLVVGISLIVTLASAIDLWLVEWNATIFRAMSLALRFSSSALTVACGLIAWWTTVLPGPVPSNLRRHAFLLTGNFGAIAIGNLVIQLLHGRNELAGAIMIGMSAGFCGLWALLINGSGETAPGWRSASPEQLVRLEERETRIYSPAIRAHQKNRPLIGR
jgi:hypothetical protein